VTANGAGITSYDVKDLPATTGQSDLAALNANDALLTLPIPYGYDTTYETSNGGVGWEKVTLPTTGSTVSVTPQCATSHLRITLGHSGVAMGHIGMNFLLKNVGKRACELDGFPTVQMIGAPRTWSPRKSRSVRITRCRSSHHGSPNQARGTAVFMLGYADMTGYGVAKCPTAHTLRITPPGDLASHDLHLEVQAYGGATIQRLVCGEITVSPIMSLSAWRHIS